MNKILVTGGAGYIGSHTVVELVNSGFKPVIIDNFSNAEKDVIVRIEQITGKPVTYYVGNCTDFNFMSEVFRKEGPVSGVIHFAANKAVGESTQQPLLYYENNLLSLIQVLKVMQAYNVSDVVFSSSCTVYGQPDQLPVTENSPVKPANSPYGFTKQFCEQILTDTVQSGAALKAIALRYFNPVGAHPSAKIGELPIGTPNNLVPFITQTAAGKREKLTVFGNDYNTPDGTCIRDYIHVVDLAKAHVKALSYLESNRERQHYEVFNIGVGQGSTVLQVIDAFEQATGVKLNYEIGPRRPGDVEKVYANAEKALGQLGWQAGLTINDAMKDAWRWEESLKNR
jgi:UDP-glucose 4-epimerase